MVHREKIINFETMSGWPICKMSLRDILNAMGAKYNTEQKTYELPDSEQLDYCPVCLHDDGMGYGVGEEYITEWSTNDKLKQYNLFLEEKLPAVDLWLKYHAFPGMPVDIDDKTYYIKSMTVTDCYNPIFILECDKDDKKLLLTGEQLVKKLEVENGETNS